MDEHNLFRFSTLTVDLSLDLLICGEKVMSFGLANTVNAMSVS